MKLSQIGESLMLAKIRDALTAANFPHRAIGQTEQPFEASSGHTDAPQNQFATAKRPKHRRQLGMEKRLGAIRL